MVSKYNSLQEAMELFISEAKTKCFSFQESEAKCFEIHFLTKKQNAFPFKKLKQNGLKYNFLQRSKSFFARKYAFTKRFYATIVVFSKAES